MGKPRLANYLKYLIVLYKYLHVFCLWDFWGLLIHSGDANSPIRKYIISYIIYKKIIHKVSITITITIIIIIIIIIKVSKFASQSIVVKALSNVKLWHRTLNKPPRNIFNFCIRYLNNTLPTLKNSCFAINLWGCGRQCQPPTPAGSNNETNNIFFCVIPPIWLP